MFEEEVINENVCWLLYNLEDTDIDTLENQNKHVIRTGLHRSNTTSTNKC